MRGLKGQNPIRDTAIVLSNQTKPKLSSQKSKVPKSRPKGLGLTLKSYEPPTPPTWIRITPLTHPAKKIDQVDSEIKDVG